MAYKITFIGHREIFRLWDYGDKLHTMLDVLLVEREQIEFFVGREGDFDRAATSVVDKLKKEGRHCLLNLVLAYPHREGEVYEWAYDKVFCPLGEKVHFKRAIRERNEWLVDHSDLVIAFVEREKGGAYQTLRYAKKKGVKILYLNEKGDGR